MTDDISGCGEVLSPAVKLNSYLCVYKLIAIKKSIRSPAVMSRSMSVLFEMREPCSTEILLICLIIIHPEKNDDVFII